ncbi:bifunctional UDP-N-acetylglucosamine diphosphorylase/glucosamine-1-phosphate N-acetyltransferase GlmU [Methylocapsa sp. S129]|uniref:bifunctional UDP-N-acetylglucosamine diphosphorylase/glucosamine-1-phosphate N-acetyltransferase GlmU n=1 Tax=Methylocapsa sp. S129 TaxID=1641869 RepID=UPI00131BD1BB|nr:bifunctional UDP-N-acetylglucosamine diphosphorylase/glucosamine-1-phosphate N-acetyltransferase GlmU [Methylocapsa sp. S129]
MTKPKPRRRLALVLAAGEGVRMKSARPKVLHEIAGRTMLAHALGAVAAAGALDVAVVIGPDRDDVAAEALRVAPAAAIFVQARRLGTAHAVLAAREAIARGYDDVLMTYADIPLIRAATLEGLCDSLAHGADVAALGFAARDPAGYGRLVEKDGRLVAIREHKDASEAERAIVLCNAGPMAIAGARALELLDQIGSDNAAGEFYLTDIVAVAAARGFLATTRIASEDEVMGVNDRVQLAAAEAVMQRRLREHAMREGATLIAPDTVFFSHDTKLGRDVLVEPHVVFGKGVEIAEGAIIHAFSHLEGAKVAAKASIGPYARLRPGADIAAGAKVGNFVEIKNASVEAGAKVNHLSYIGDARVGAGANIGAGTITCNYDGFSKFRTDIGAGAFVGSNSALVAPVTIGAGAYIGSGSVVTEDVEPDALAIGRGRQVAKPGWAKAFRARQKPKKAAE